MAAAGPKYTTPVRYTMCACVDFIHASYADVPELWIPKGYVGTHDAKEAPIPAGQSWRLNVFDGKINLTETVAPANDANRDVPAPLTAVEIPQTLIVMCNNLSNLNTAVLKCHEAIMPLVSQFTGAK